MLLLLQRLPDTGVLQPHVDELLPIAKSISRQLVGWIEASKNSQNRGPRHENSATRKARDDARRREDFLKMLEHLVDDAEIETRPGR